MGEKQTVAVKLRDSAPDRRVCSTLLRQHLQGSGGTPRRRPLLFIAATLLPMFLPSGWNLDLFTRALVAVALFNAAMAAEVFRGGLQSASVGAFGQRAAGVRALAVIAGLTRLNA